MEKRIAVVGLGLSGRAALRLLRHARPEAALATFDKAAAADFNDGPRLLREFRPDMLVVSPGVPLASAWIADFAKGGGVLTNELDLAAAQLGKERVLGITGSLGKSTTVALLEAALRAEDAGAVAVGNIGYPLADYVVDVSEQRRPAARWLACELSSYQLENLQALRFAHTAITYLSANHLDRYPDRDAYYAAKWRLLSLTDGRCVLNPHGGDLAAWAAAHPSPKCIDASEAGPLTEAELESARLIGTHNHDNMRVAWALARLAGFGDTAKRALLAFGGLPHRLERAGEHGGVSFVNDSKATTMESVLTAYRATEGSVKSVGSIPAGAIHLLLGGKDKSLPWHELAALAAHPRCRPIFFGQCGALARAASGLEGPVVAGLEDAVREAKRVARAGDTVLLSPGGSSLDEFKNFEERGRRFADLARLVFSTPI